MSDKMQIWSFEGTHDVREEEFNGARAWIARDVCVACGLTPKPAQHTRGFKLPTPKERVWDFQFSLAAVQF